MYKRSILIMLCFVTQYAHAGNWCLKREDPNGTKSEVLVGERSIHSDWKTDGVIIHKTKSSTACGTGTDCNVGLFDQFRLSPQPLPSKKIDFTFRPSEFGGSELTAVLEVKDNGRYLQGTIGRSPKPDIEVFVIYNRILGSPCKIENFTYPQACETFDLEFYPADQAKWNDHRPDSMKVVWETFAINKNCTSYTNQPGGGGGHDPPVHP